MDNKLVTTGDQAIELVRLTEQELLKIYSPASIKALTKRLNNANDLIKAENNTPSLGYICKVLKNEKLALALVKLHIIDLLDFINPARSMSIEQVEQTAELLISDYSYLKIADLLLVFKKAKKGEFGQLYEGIDGMKILQWFTQTWSDRMDAAEQQSQQEAASHKQALMDIAGDRRISDASSIKQAHHEALLRYNREKTGQDSPKEGGNNE